MVQPGDDAEKLIEDLVLWLREEVAPVVRSGSNWKAIINGRGTADWSFVIEKHGGRRCQPGRSESVN